MLVTYLKTLISTAGHLSCVCILVGTNIVVGAIEGTARGIVKVIATITFARIEQEYRTPHAERVRTFQDKENDLVVYRPNTGSMEDGKAGPAQVIDEEQTLQKTIAHAKVKNPEFNDTFIGDEAKMIELAKRLISNEFGGDNPDLLSEDFQFVFPVVGPLTKEQFIRAFTDFKLRDAFPTSSGNFYNFKVDPLEPNRVWFLGRGSFTHLGDFVLGFQTFPGTGKRISLAPQCCSASFDEHGKCYKFTGGYVVDRSVGDTSGLGGIFGILTGLDLVSLPFPEGRPWKPSMMWEAFTLRLAQIQDDWRAIMKPNVEKKMKSQ